MRPASAQSWNLSMAARTSRSVRFSSTSFWRRIDTRAIGSAADARIMMTAVVTISSMNENPLDDLRNQRIVTSLFHYDVRRHHLDRNRLSRRARQHAGHADLGRPGRNRLELHG